MLKKLLRKFTVSGRGLSRDIEMVRESGFFDVEEYLRRYPDVAGSNMDPVEHFVRIGGLEGRQPGPGFDTSFYLSAYPDVARKGVNPLVHYLRSGRARGRRPRADAPPGSGPELAHLDKADSGIQLLQMQLLDAAYPEFDRAMQALRQILPGSRKLQDTLFCLQAERLLATGQLADLVAMARSDSSHPLSSYYLAKADFMQANYRSAIDRLQAASLDAATDESPAYLLADAARAAGDLKLAWRVLADLTRHSGRARTWRHLADLVSNPRHLQRYLELLKGWSRRRPESAKDRDVVAATVAAALAAGNDQLARRILHDAILHHSKKIGGPRTPKNQTVRYSELDGLPLWPMPFEYLRLDRIMPPLQRARVALIDTNALFRRHGLNAFLIKQTLAACLSGDANLLAQRALEFGVLEGVDTAALLEGIAADPLFSAMPTRDPGRIIRLQHANGIGITIHVHGIRGSVVEHGEHGIRWANRWHGLTQCSCGGVDFLVPEEPQAYLGEFSAQKIGADFDWVLQSDNARVENESRLAIYAYQTLLDAIVLGRPAAEASALRVLRELGEGKAVSHAALTASHVPDLPQLRRDAPEVVLHVSGLENVGYQANMWLPVLEKLSVRCAVVIRERRIAAELAPTRLPVYLLEGQRELELLETVGVKTVLYPANTQKNTHMLRFSRMNHFFINHGDSDKVVNQSKFLMAYDKLLVAGPLAEKRIRDARLPVRQDQIVHVGRPQTELMLKRVNGPAQAIRTILYAPTWEGFVEDANYSSVNEFGLAMMEALAADERFRVLIKPHPYTGSKSPETRQALDRLVLRTKKHSHFTMADPNSGIHDLMNQSDVLITDISSVLTEYLYTLKPIVVTSPRGEPAESMNRQYPTTRAAYILTAPAEIAGLMDRIASSDTLFETRRQVCAESLGDFPEGAMARFNKVICESVSMSPSPGGKGSETG